MVIRALAVFERVIHHGVAMNTDHPTRPVLEVDALLRDGDADGELLLPTPSYMAMLGGPDLADAPLRDLFRAGRLVEHQGLHHVRFPLWRFADEA